MKLSTDMATCIRSLPEEGRRYTITFMKNLSTQERNKLSNPFKTGTDEHTRYALVCSLRSCAAGYDGRIYMPTADFYTRAAVLVAYKKIVSSCNVIDEVFSLDQFSDFSLHFSLAIDPEQDSVSDAYLLKLEQAVSWLTLELSQVAQLYSIWRDCSKQQY
jgi:hypothetical protein